MKQMIKNHREIESLEDFIYYDKASGKIKIKKELDLAFPVGKKLYIHFVTISKTNDVEDYPNIGFNFISGDATVDKTKIENYIKKVASTNASYKGIHGLGSQDGYTYSEQGPYGIYFLNNHFYAGYLGNANKPVIDFGNTIPYIVDNRSYEL